MKKQAKKNYKLGKKEFPKNKYLTGWSDKGVIVKLHKNGHSSIKKTLYCTYDRNGYSPYLI